MSDNNFNDSLKVIEYVKSFAGDKLEKALKALKTASQIDDNIFYCLASSKKSLQKDPSLKTHIKNRSFVISDSYSPTFEEIDIERELMKSKITTYAFSELYIDMPEKRKID